MALARPSNWKGGEEGGGGGVQGRAALHAGLVHQPGRHEVEGLHGDGREEGGDGAREGGAAHVVGGNVVLRVCAGTYGHICMPHVCDICMSQVCAPSLPCGTCTQEIITPANCPRTLTTLLIYVDRLDNQRIWQLPNMFHTVSITSPKTSPNIP